MLRIATAVAAVVLVVHGLIHLMGTAVYMKLAEVSGLTYKTTLLNGRWDVGENGIRVFGGLWALPAIGFVVAALALLAGTEWWKALLLAATLFSLALTSLDWSSAFMGAITDIAILAFLWLWLPIARWIS